MDYLKIIILFLMAVLAKLAEATNEKCTHLLTGHIQGVFLQAGSLWLVFNNEVYAISPNKITADSINLSAPSSLSSIFKLSPDELPSGSTLLQVVPLGGKMFHLVLKGAPDKVVNVLSKSMEDASTSAPGPFALISGSQDPSSQSFVIRPRVWTSADQIVWCWNEHQIPFQNELTKPYLIVTTNTTTVTIQFTDSASEVVISPSELLISRLPVFGFIHGDTIHLWDTYRRHVYLLPYGAINDVVKDGSTLTLPLVSICFDKYFNCGSGGGGGESEGPTDSTPTLNVNSQLLWIILIILLVLITLCVVLLGCLKCRQMSMKTSTKGRKLKNQSSSKTPATISISATKSFKTALKSRSGSGKSIGHKSSAFTVTASSQAKVVSNGTTSSTSSSLVSNIPNSMTLEHASSPTVSDKVRGQGRSGLSKRPKSVSLDP